MILKTLWASHMMKGAQIRKTVSEYVMARREALLSAAVEPFAKSHKDQRTRIIFEPHRGLLWEIKSVTHSRCT